MKHLFRIISSIVLVVAFIWIGIKIESWFWLAMECFVMLMLCGLIIHIDVCIEKAHEMPDGFNELISESESKQIIEISKSVPYSPNEIYASYIILDSFELVKRAAFLSIHYGEDLIHVSNRIKHSIETINQM